MRGMQKIMAMVGSSSGIVAEVIVVVVRKIPLAVIVQLSVKLKTKIIKCWLWRHAFV